MAGSGDIDITADGVFSSIVFDQLSPTTDVVPGPELVIGTGSGDVINYVQGPNSGSANPPINGATTGEVAVNASEPVEFANKTSLTIQDETGNNTINIEDPTIPTGLTDITVNGGQGDNVLNVQDLPAPLTLEFNATSGNNTFNVSSNAPTNTGTLAMISGVVTLNPGLGMNSLNVSESGSAASDTVLVTDAQISSSVVPFTINYAGSFGGGVDFFGGSATNVFNVQSTLAGGTTSVIGGSGGNTFNVSSDAPANTGTLLGLAGTLSIEGGIGSNTLNVSESGSSATDEVVITNGRISSAVVPFTIDYAVIAGGSFNGSVNFAGGSGGNTYDVESTVAGDPYVLDTGTGGDTVKVGSDPVNANNSVLDNIQGALSIVAQDPMVQDNVFFNDHANAVGSTYTLTATTFIRTNIAQITYDAVNIVQVNGGSGGNVYDIEGTHANTGYDIETGAGADTINVGSDPITLANSTLDNIQGPFTIRGQDAAVQDVVNVNDQGNATAGTTYLLDLAHLRRSNASIFAFLMVGSVTVNGGSGGNTYDVLSTAAGTTYTVNGGAGNDIVNVSSNAPINTGDLTGLAKPTVDRRPGRREYVQCERERQRRRRQGGNDHERADREHDHTVHDQLRRYRRDLRRRREFHRHSGQRSHHDRQHLGSGDHFGQWRLRPGSDHRRQCGKRARDPWTARYKQPCSRQYLLDSRRFRRHDGPDRHHQLHDDSRFGAR
jgi:hypothetical protein